MIDESTGAAACLTVGERPWHGLGANVSEAQTSADAIRLARRHNDANIISIPARFTSIQQAVDMVDTFLNTSFEGGRHANRVNKIACQ